MSSRNGEAEIADAQREHRRKAYERCSRLMNHPSQDGIPEPMRRSIRLPDGTLAGNHGIVKILKIWIPTKLFFKQDGL
jgi:hypothetical protein